MRPEGKAIPLDRLAQRLVAEAEAGSIPALRESGDRVDGKSLQAVQLSGDKGGPLVVTLPPMDAIRATMRERMRGSEEAK